MIEIYLNLFFNYHPARPLLVNTSGAVYFETYYFMKTRYLSINQIFIIIVIL